MIRGDKRSSRRWAEGYSSEGVESKKCYETGSIFLEIKVRVHSMGGKNLIPSRGRCARKEMGERGTGELR
jgi:hypothetical protein